MNQATQNAMIARNRIPTSPSGEKSVGDSVTRQCAPNRTAPTAPKQRPSPTAGRPARSKPQANMGRSARPSTIPCTGNLHLKIFQGTWTSAAPGCRERSPQEGFSTGGPHRHPERRCLPKIFQGTCIFFIQERCRTNDEKVLQFKSFPRILRDPGAERRVLPDFDAEAVLPQPRSGAPDPPLRGPRPRHQG